MFEVPGVRVQQAIVLSALRRHPGQNVTVPSLATELNRGLPPGVPPITLEDVECTLAALLLRPDLKAFISVTTRPVATEERSQRLALGHALLASTVLLAACATPFGQGAAKPRLNGYFGGVGTVPRIASALATSGTREYTSTLLGCGDQLCIAIPTARTAGLSPKTIPSPQFAHAEAAYFDYQALLAMNDVQHPTFAERAHLPYPQRAEADLWTPHIPSVHTQVASLDSVPAVPRLERQEIAVPVPVEPLVTSTHTVAALIVAPPPDGMSSDVEHFLVTFRNGSQILTDQAHLQALSIAKTLDPSDKIELRGRVGKTSIQPEDARLAVARAIAVRKQLVAYGFSEKNIRIRLPKSGDLLDRNAFDAPVNMSVSVFRMPANTAVALRTKAPSTTG